MTRSNLIHGTSIETLEELLICTQDHQERMTGTLAQIGSDLFKLRRRGKKTRCTLNRSDRHCQSVRVQCIMENSACRTDLYNLRKKILIVDKFCKGKIPHSFFFHFFRINLLKSILLTSIIPNANRGFLSYKRHLRRSILSVFSI